MRTTERYGNMLDSSFGPYYERFYQLNALSKETAVTKKELFPEGYSYRDHSMMHKMLSMEIVKRVGLNRYWLDENRASSPGAVLRQRLLIIAAAIAIVLLWELLEKYGIL